jgi:hypothetical protein
MAVVLSSRGDSMGCIGGEQLLDASYSYKPCNVLVIATVTAIDAIQVLAASPH